MKKNKIQVNELSESTKKSLKVRIISAIIAVIVVFPCVIVGDWFFMAVAIFAIVVGTYELIKCAKPRHSVWLYIVSLILIMALACWPIFREIFLSNIKHTGWKVWSSFETLYLSILVLVIAFMTIFFFVVIDKGTTVGDASFIFTLGVIVALGIQCLLFLRYYPIVDKYGWNAGDPLPNVKYFNTYENLGSSTLLLYVVIGAFMTDIGAYFVGVFFGKHKMNERISPKKTWEGFFGGIVFSAIASFLFAFIFALNKHPLISALDINHWYYIVILSIMIPLFSTLGDFVFSSFKRYYGIKDFGNIMPGHGGILDRIDSLLFAVIVVAVFVCIISGKELPLL